MTYDYSQSIKDGTMVHTNHWDHPGPKNDPNKEIGQIVPVQDGFLATRPRALLWTEMSMYLYEPRGDLGYFFDFGLSYKPGTNYLMAAKTSLDKDYKNFI